MHIPGSYVPKKPQEFRAEPGTSRNSLGILDVFQCHGLFPGTSSCFFGQELGTLILSKTGIPRNGLYVNRTAMSATSRSSSVILLVVGRVLGRYLPHITLENFNASFPYFLLEFLTVSKRNH